MSTEDKKKLTPFEKARLNIKKTAQNFNFYSSVEMLAFAIQTLNRIEDDLDEQGEMEKMCHNLIKELSELLLADGGTWD